MLAVLIRAPGQSSVAVVAAIYLVVHKTLAPTHKPAAPTSHPLVRLNPKKTSGADRPAARRRVYVVKAGDSLSAIAVKMKMSVATLESLNPKVNPNTLQAGQRLALVP